jgi:hypothetical protein
VKRSLPRDHAGLKFPLDRDERVIAVRAANDHILEGHAASFYVNSSGVEFNLKSLPLVKLGNNWIQTLWRRPVDVQGEFLFPVISKRRVGVIDCFAVVDNYF